MRRRWLAVCAMMVGVVGSPVARGADDVRALEKQLADELVALSTSDCTLACRALASIHRAAERICALEPGPRCDAARAKAADAERRVREACPACAIEQAAPAGLATKQEEAAPAAEQVVVASPRSEPRGGCRSCTTAPAPNPGGIAWLVLVAIGTLGFRRAAKNRR
jgi:MYXO-CTERM domain-containing protein